MGLLLCMGLVEDGAEGEARLDSEGCALLETLREGQEEALPELEGGMLALGKLLAVVLCEAEAQLLGVPS